MQQAARFGARQAARGGVRMRQPDCRRKARRSEAGWGARRRWRRIRPFHPSRTRCARFPVPRERPFRPCVQREGRPRGRPRAPVPRASRACRAPASTVSRACSFRRSPPSFPLGWREVLLCPMPVHPPARVPRMPRVAPHSLAAPARESPRVPAFRASAPHAGRNGVFALHYRNDRQACAAQYGMAGCREKNTLSRRPALEPYAPFPFFAMAAPMVKTFRIPLPAKSRPVLFPMMAGRGRA